MHALCARPIASKLASAPQLAPTLLLGALVAACLPAAAGARPPTGPTPSGEPGAEAAAPRGGSVSRLRADLLRRQGGEWVIVNLVAGDSSPLAASRSGGSAADRDGVRAALGEYEQALRSRDARRLARVWIMNPAEQAQIERFFDEAAEVRVSIRDTDMRIEGDRASADFDQQLSVRRRSWIRRALSPGSWRGLFARDAHGTWNVGELPAEE